MAQALFNETNLANSISLVLAARLLEAGYLVYWHRSDAVQTPDGWYFEYSTTQATHLADPTFAARLAASRGLITVRGKPTAIPEYPVRPTSDGTVSSQDELSVPVLTVEIGPVVSGLPDGLGSRVRQRARHLAIYGLARDAHEQGWLRDMLQIWFDEGECLEVHNHDDGSLSLVGTLETQMVQSASALNVLSPGGHTYEIVLNAQVVYFA